jgi:hypothetical protein
MKLSWFRLSILMLLCLVVAIFLSSVRLFQYGYTPTFVYVLSLLSALAYGSALSNPSGGDTTSRQRIHWLAVLLLVFSTTIGATSSNGLGQSTGAFMVGLPLLLAMGATHVQNESIKGQHLVLRISCAILLSALFVTHWAAYPYREYPWWRTNHPIQSVSEFRFINTTTERSEFIRRIQDVLGPVAKNKRTLIVSDVPALYFALDTFAETCMLYMHSIASDQSEKALLDCLGKKSPEVVIDFSSEGSRIHRLLKVFYGSQEFRDLSVPVIRLRTNQ